MSYSRKAGRYAAGVSVVALACGLALAPPTSASNVQPEATNSHSALAAPALSHTRHTRLAPLASANPHAGAPKRVAHATQPADDEGVCGTEFGPELSTPDGIIAWNDTSGSGFDTSGAADVYCSTATTISDVEAYGYFGDPTETFHVTFYGDSTSGGTSEPDDTKVLCDYPALTGAAGGQYPTHVLTHLFLSPACNLPAGVAWVSIQNVDANGPWYWEMQDSSSGNSGPDWRDRNDVFGSGCTTFDNNRYLVDCLGYPYPDWMLTLSGKPTTLHNLTTKHSTVGYGNKKCPGSDYYRYSGGHQDNTPYALPIDPSYPSYALTQHMGSSIGGNVDYDVSMDNGRFGDSFNLQNNRTVCYAVIQFLAKGTGDIPGNDVLSIGHADNASPYTYTSVASVVAPFPGPPFGHYALTSAGLAALSAQTSASDPNDTRLDVYLEDDTEIDFFRMYVWYNP